MFSSSTNSCESKLPQRTAAIRWISTGGKRTCLNEGIFRNFNPSCTRRERCSNMISLLASSSFRGFVITNILVKDKVLDITLNSKYPNLMFLSREKEQ